MKTILFTLSSIADPYKGGIERVTDILTKEFQERGYRVIHIYFRDFGIESFKYKYPCEVYKFPTDKCCTNENFLFYDKFVEENKVDFIINQTGLSEYRKVILSIRRVKTVTVIHSNPTMNYNFLWTSLLKRETKGVKGKIRKLVYLSFYPFYKMFIWLRLVCQYDFVVRNSDMTSLLSERYIPELKSIAFRLDDSKIFSVGNPNTYDAQEIDYSKKQKRVLYVGRFERVQKRVDRLLKIWGIVMDEFPDWELVIVGYGESQNELEAIAKKMKRVRFEGRQNPTEYYKTASVFCLTSSYEGFPMILNEAKIYGVVPIAFQSFSAVEDVIIDGKDGFLAEPYNYQQYADKLRKLMNDDAKRLEMATEAQKSATKFDVSIIANHWESLFK